MSALKRIEDLFDLETVEVPGKEFKVIYEYLSNKPYHEVWHIIDALREIGNKNLSITAIKEYVNLGPVKE